MYLIDSQEQHLVTAGTTDFANTVLGSGEIISGLAMMTILPIGSVITGEMLFGGGTLGTSLGILGAGVFATLSLATMVDGIKRLDS